MPRWSRMAVAGVLLAGLAAAPGCRVVQDLLGYPGDYVLAAGDALALPDETVVLKASLHKGGIPRDQEGKEIRLCHDGQVLASARTDEEGEARIPFRPPHRGNYLLQVEYDPPPREHSPPVRVDVLVACHPAETPLLIVDIDHTLTDSAGRKVLTGDPTPMPGAQAAMSHLAGTFTVVYLTARPIFLAHKTRRWLTEHGYPPGPVLTSDLWQALSDSQASKSEALAEIRRRFTGPAAGIGDRASDVRAYAQRGLRALLLVPVHRLTRPDELRSAARALSDLPPTIEVVLDWDQVPAALLEGQRYPLPMARDRLRQMADLLEGRQ